MKVVVGIDWSEQAFGAAQQLLQLYQPAELTLVHAVDFGLFKYPLVAQAANLQGYDEFRKALSDAGHQAIARTVETLSLAPESITRVNEIGNPADIILRTAERVGADLVVVGARGQGRIAELFLGSVSHRILLHATCPTLVVKGASTPIRRVLVAVEGHDDARRITEWLLVHPFRNPVDVTILSVVVPLAVAEPYTITGYQAWMDTANAYAEDLVKKVGADLMGSRYSIGTRVAVGDVASSVAEQAKQMDLVVVASHGRKGLERFLMGSTSHAIVHQVTCPVLVVR